MRPLTAHSTLLVTTLAIAGSLAPAAARADHPATFPAGEVCSLNKYSANAALAANVYTGMTPTGGFHIPSTAAVIGLYPIAVCPLPRAWADAMSTVSITVHSDAIGANGSTASSRYVNCMAKTYAPDGTVAAPVVSGTPINLAAGTSAVIELPLNYNIAGTEAYVVVSCALWGVGVQTIRVRP